MKTLPLSPTLLAITALQGAGAALLFTSVLVLTYALGPELYGRYAWVVAGGGILSLVVQYGLPTTIVKSFAPLDLKGAEALPVAFTVASLWGLSVLVTIGVTLVDGFVKGLPRAEMIWILPIGLGLAYVSIADATLRAADQGLRANIAKQLIRPGLLVAVALTLLLYKVVDPSDYLLSYAAAGLVSGIAFLWHLPVSALRNLDKAAWVRSNPAHFQVALARSVSNFLPVFISGLFLPPEQVAYFAIAIQLTAPLQFGLAATRSFYAAKINARIKQSDEPGARRTLRGAAFFSRSIALLAALAIPALYVALNSIGIDPLAKFDDTYLLFLVFLATALGQFGYAMFGPVQMVAILLDDERRVLLVTVTLTACFAIGLTVMALSGSVLAVAVTMPVYTIALTTSLRLRVARSFDARKFGQET
ncbi:MAG: hypothetical protein AAGA34_06710 [Pseudomonadota bacterium]